MIYLYFIFCIDSNLKNLIILLRSNKDIIYKQKDVF
jgi:hypothetical protein